MLGRIKQMSGRVTEWWLKALPFLPRALLALSLAAAVLAAAVPCPVQAQQVSITGPTVLLAYVGRQFSYPFGLNPAQSITGTWTKLPPTPAWVNLTSDGRVNGIPPLPNLYNCSISWTGGGKTAPPYPFTVDARCPISSIEFSDPPPFQANVGQPFSYQFRVSGESSAPTTGAVSWRLSGPSWLSVNQSGQVSGTPSADGLYDFTINWIKSLAGHPCIDIQPFPFHVQVGSATSTVVINHPGLLHATAGQQFSYPFALSGDSKCGTTRGGVWSLSKSVWMNANQSTGQVFGTPPTAGTFNYTIYWELNTGSCTDKTSLHFQVQVDGGGSTGDNTNGSIIIIESTDDEEQEQTPPTSPSVLSFTASPVSIRPGQSVTLAWSTSNASSVSISQVGAVAASSTTTVTPSATTTYTLTATGESGTSPTSADATVTVKPWTAPAISTGKSTIESGKSATLSWDAEGASRVTITDVGIVAATGSMAVTPEETTTYNLKATYPDGSSQTASVTLIVEAPPPNYALYGLIGLLGLAAAAAIVYLVVRRSAARPALQSGTIKSVSTVAPPPPVTSVATGASAPTAVASGAPTLAAALPARFLLSGGGEVPLSGSERSYGRNDFKGLTTAEKSSLLSRQHMTIKYDEGHYYIEDRDSTNGTKVNGIEIRGTGKHALRDGDAIVLADEISMTFKM